MFHDDAARLDFRDFSAFIESVLELARSSGNLRTADLPAQYDVLGDRTADDVGTAMRLLELAERMPKGRLLSDRDEALTFAIRLLTDGQQGEIIKQLDASTDVRAAALKRLQEIPTGEARAAIEKYKRDFERFVNAATAVVRDSGITVEAIQSCCILIQPARVWIDLGSFYEERHEPDILEQVVRRAKEFNSERSRGGR